jgi:hypothetical protein
MAQLRHLSKNIAHLFARHHCGQSLFALRAGDTGHAEVAPERALVQELDPAQGDGYGRSFQFSLARQVDEIAPDLTSGGDTVAKIVKQNNIRNPDRLVVGQVLLVRQPKTLRDEKQELPNRHPRACAQGTTVLLYWGNKNAN